MQCIGQSVLLREHTHERSCCDTGRVNCPSMTPWAVDWLKTSSRALNCKMESRELQKSSSISSGTSAGLGKTSSCFKGQRKVTSLGRPMYMVVYTYQYFSDDKDTCKEGSQLPIGLCFTSGPHTSGAIHQSIFHGYRRRPWGDHQSWHCTKELNDCTLDYCHAKFWIWILMGINAPMRRFICATEAHSENVHCMAAALGK